jgi:hypothetical protein
MSVASAKTREIAMLMFLVTLFIGQVTGRDYGDHSGTRPW